MTKSSKPKAHPGRPPLPAHKLRGAIIRVRCTLAEFDKFTLLGGAAWLRKALKRARVAYPEP